MRPNRGTTDAQGFLARVVRARKKKVFFFEKKKQKTFGRCRGVFSSTYLKT